MTDTTTRAWLDQEDRHVAEMIRKHGCYIEYVLGCTCGVCNESTAFAYSVGFFGLGHPELLVLGVRQATAAGVINTLFARVKAGQDLVPGQLVTFDDWPHKIVVEEVPNPGEIVFTANRHYDRPAEASVPVLQLTWDDRSGRS
jgi:hypothetical protein